MVAERDVLFGVEHLEHRGGRVSAEIAAHLVDLVEQDERIGRSGTAQRVHDASGHCADVGLSVTADVGLIAHAAQTHAGIAAAHRLRDGFRDRGLADARRACETEHLSLEAGRERADRQKLHDALLDLFHAVVVAVEDALRLLEVETLLAPAAPRQIEHGIEISAHDALLRIRAAELGEAVHLADELFLAFLRQLEVEDALTVGLSLRRCILLAELGLDDLDLLAQVVFALIFIHLGLNFVLDLVFKLEHLGLLAEQADDHGQTARDAELLEDVLLGRNLDTDVLRDVIREEACVAALGNRQLHIGRDSLRIVGVLRKALLRRADKRLRTAFGHTVNIVLELLDLGIDAGLVVLRREELMHERALLALDEHADVVARQAQDLLDLADGADLVEIARGRVVRLEVALCGQKERLTVFHRRFQRADGKQTAHIEVDYHIRERNEAAQRKHRQAAYSRSKLFCHSVSPCRENSYIKTV